MNERLGPPARVEHWYDHRQHLWCVMTVDAQGHQVGIADYVPRPSLKATIEAHQKELPAGIEPC